MQTEGYVVKVFDDLAVGWSQLYGEGNPAENYLFIVRKKRVEQLLDGGVGPGLRVLDVGCGTGIMAPYFAQKGAIYFGIDISGKMVAQAKKEIFQILKTQEHTSFAQGDVKHLDFPDGYFDIVISLGLLEFLEDREAAIKEIVRVTHSSGTIVVAVPNKQGLNQMARRYFRPVVIKSIYLLMRLLGKPQTHRYPYSYQFLPKELESVLQKYGCKKTGEAFYDMEILLYPFNRMFPRFALFVKRWAEIYQRVTLKHCANGYICKVEKT